MCSCTQTRYIPKILSWPYKGRPVSGHFGMGEKSAKPPTRCKCGKSLAKPHLVEHLNLPVWHPLYSHKQNVNMIECTCGRVYYRSFPQIWKETHILELARPYNKYSRNFFYHY